MFDGQETVTLAPNVLVADDVGVVSQVIIRITNPVHNMEESLSVTLSGNTNIELVSSEIMLILFLGCHNDVNKTIVKINYFIIIIVV